MRVLGTTRRTLLLRRNAGSCDWRTFWPGHHAQVLASTVPLLPMEFRRTWLAERCGTDDVD